MNSRLNGRGRARRCRQRAFTLTEMMIVVAIVGLLASMALPGFMKARDNACLNTIYRNLRTLDGAKEQWALDNRKAQGAVIGDISELKDYLRGGKVKEVIRESYVLNPIGTPPDAALPNDVRLGTYAPGALIPAP